MANASVAEKFRSMESGAAPEASSNTLAWLDRFGRRFGHFIGGKWQRPAAGNYFATADPSTGEKLAEVAAGTAAGGKGPRRGGRGGLPGRQGGAPHRRGRPPVRAP